MAKFLEVMGSSGKIVINISQILTTEASSSGCTLYLAEKKIISLKTSYAEVRKAIEDAAATDREIHSIVDDNSQDLLPRTPINPTLFH